MRGSRQVAARALVVAAAALAVLAAAAGRAQASPADPNVVKTLRQPDGSTIQVHLWGDEFAHGYETLDGYTVALDAKDKTWKFAERDARGRLKPSNEKANGGARPQGKHVRPSTAAINETRTAAGAPPLGAPYLAAAPGWAGNDTDLLFLVVEFTDTGCTFTPAQMQTNMFGGGASGPGDLDDFFAEISYGQLKIVGNVVGNQAGTDCIALGDTRNHYNVTAANGDDDIVREAVAAADGYVDFANYDNDNDGTVDALGIIYAGGGPHDGCAVDAAPNGSGGDNLWPHSGKADTGAAVTADGKTIRPFIINSELTYALANPSNCNQIQTIGLFAHELGHSLGLPDLYDTDIGSGGVHTWSTMASQYLGTANNADTPPHYDPWSKAFEGWVTPTVHQPGDRFTDSISRVEDSGEVHEFRSNPGGFEIGGSGEYFLVENRQQTLFDAQIAGCGLLVWHIDEAQSDNTKGGHTAASHRLVDVDEADGLAELDANGTADAGDPFPGSTNNTLFADTTNPSSKLYDGTSSNVRMRVLSTGCASSMSAAFGANRPPVASAGGPYSTNEGTDVGLTAAGSSDPDGDALSYAWDLDNDGQYDDSTSQTPSFTNVGDNGTFTVGVRVTDAFGDSSTASTTVTVANVAPSVASLMQNGPQVENTAVTVGGSISDPGWLDTLTATVDWGDGGGPQALAGSAENVRPDATLAFSVAHTYGDNGSYSVQVCASDDDGGGPVCSSVPVTVTNVVPTVAIDESGTVLVNGVPTVIAQAGSAVSLSGGSTDPGSDDLTLSWLWNDGSPDTSTLYLVNPPAADPAPSPSIQARDVTDTQSHAFAACLYDVGFRSTDDDTGQSTDTVKVMILGNGTARFSVGYWQRQLSGKPTDFSTATLGCYLEIVGFVSNLFGEVVDVSTIQKAAKLLKAGGNTSAQDQFDRQLLAALLNFANGEPDYDETIDTNGDGTGDTPFLTVVANAEAVRLNPASTDDALIAQKDLLERINLGKA